MTEKETATRIAWVWIENDEGLYNGVYARAREIAKESARPADDLADFIREYLDDSAPLTEAGIYTDLLSFAIETVDYCQIARDILTDIAGAEPV